MRIIDESLNNVSRKLLCLWDMVEKSYVNIRNSYVNNDKRLALKIARTDKLINNLEEEINDDIIQTITLHSPVASDLRLLISAIKIASQLERVADYTVNVSDYILTNENEKIATNTFAKDYLKIVNNNIVKIIDNLISMIKFSRKGLITQDLKFVQDILLIDEEIDIIYSNSLNKLVIYISSQDQELVDMLAKINMNTILLFKYLERSGDHLVNIAEIIFYLIKGRNYDHHIMLDFSS